MAGGRWKKNNSSPSSSTSTSTSSLKKRKRKRPNSKLLPIQNLPSLISLVASAISAAHTFLSQNDLQLHPSQTLTLESKVTSTAHSLTKLNSILSKTTQTPPPLLSLSLSSTSFSSHSSPSPCWFERFLSAASDKSDPRWVEAFRMSKLSFALLLQTLIPHLQKSASSDTPPDHMLAATLFRLAHATSFNSVGRRFGMDSATACRAFYEVCKAIIDQLEHLFEFPSDLNRIIVGFGWISLPNCCGALGFSRFLVEGGDSEKKDDAALIVQGLVDSEGRFLDVSAGWPGSMNPSTILPHTKLFSRVEESKELLHGPSFQFRDGTSIPQYIIGNSSCHLLPWLLTPYPTSSKGDHCNFSEEAFNVVHTRGMKLVSTAFRRLRTRWRLLATKWKKEAVESYPFVIVAGCLLHNFLLKCSEPLPEDNVDSSGDVQEEFPMSEGNRNKIGEHIRDGLALQLGPARQMR